MSIGSSAVNVETDRADISFAVIVNYNHLCSVITMLRGEPFCIGIVAVKVDVAMLNAVLHNLNVSAGVMTVVLLSVLKSILKLE